MKLVNIPLKPKDWKRIIDSLEFQGYKESEELANKINVFLEAEGIKK